MTLKDVSKNPEEVKNILRLFGISGDTKNSEQEVAEIGVSRLAFWDCALNEDWEKAIRDDNQLLTDRQVQNLISNSLYANLKATNRNFLI